MKSFIAFTLLLCCLLGPTMAKFNEDILKNRGLTDCFNEHSVSLIEILAVPETLEHTRPNKSLMCAVKCILQKVTPMNDLGVIEDFNADEYFSDQTIAKYVQGITEQCKHDRSDPCENAFATFVCLQLMVRELFGSSLVFA